MSRCTGGQERGGEELLLNILFGNTEIAGEHVHTPNDVKTRQRQGEN